MDTTTQTCGSKLQALSTRVESELLVVPTIERLPDIGSESEEKQAKRLRQKREALAQQLEIEELEERLAKVRRRRRASRTHGGTKEPDYSEDVTSTRGTSLSRSACSLHRSTSRAGLMKLKELELFRGRTLREARDFIRTLELVFALLGYTYSSEREKVLYSVMFLAGKPRET
ncbi:MAG: hypothetical protein FE78DRAFT_30893 [Acidomyces sp. 'richmondensis']|nr:MAG: hypothetical protein FE78DRAFT_30893 [Acidomyces sp. 'richmondensis']